MSTALRLLPGYGWHVVARPYRVGLPARPGGRVWEVAAYDLFLNLLLSGFTELAGRPVRRGTGQLLVLINRIAFLADDEFERRVRKESVAFDELARTVDIGRAIADMRAYLARTCDPVRAEAIRGVLRRTVETEYRRYAAVIERRSGAPSVADLLDDAAVDSGAVLRQLAEVAGLFNGFAAPRAALDDFYALGLAGKFADDLRDWRRDRQTGSGNILLAILARYPNEERRVAGALDAGLRMHEKRWGRLCPGAFGEFANLYSEHYRRIRSTSLRVAADLMVEPGRTGHLPRSGGRTAARV